MLVCLSSCSEYRRVQKKGTFEEQFAMATRLYSEEEYSKASLLFENLLPMTKGREEEQQIRIEYAYCQYYMEEYVFSSHYFQKFYETYPRSEKVEEAYYMYAKSLAEMSPRVNLDQTNTTDAIKAYSYFVKKYPKSAWVDDCKKELKLLGDKLELKDYNNAKLYFKIGYYKSAVVAFDDFIKKYPASKYREELIYLKVDSQYQLARKSKVLVLDDDGKLIELRLQRLEEVKKFYYNFVDAFPQSKYSKSAENIYKMSQEKLKELNDKA